MKKILVALLLLPALIPALAVPAANDEFILVIDAGHGGKDPGAVNGKNQEKTVNLAVALKMGELIEKNCKNVKVIYTRKTDVFVELYKRAEIANKAHADMFISIHSNANNSKSVKGAETYLLGVEENRTSANLNVALAENNAIMYETDYEAHYEGYDPNSPESMIIFEFMQNEHQKESLKMAGFAQKRMTSDAKRTDRGVHQAGYLVLWKNSMPSILVELGYISNQDECKYLVSDNGIGELAKSLAAAFGDYIAYHRGQESKAVQYGESSTEKTVTINNSDTTGQTGTVWKIQFMASDKIIPEKDKRLEGLESCSYYEESGLFKYTCGDNSDKSKVQEYLKVVRKRYPDAFPIQFTNGKKHTGK